jgi:hypothetical protein
LRSALPLLIARLKITFKQATSRFTVAGAAFLSGVRLDGSERRLCLYASTMAGEMLIWGDGFGWIRF